MIAYPNTVIIFETGINLFTRAKKQNIFDKTGDLYSKVVFLQGISTFFMQEMAEHNDLGWKGEDAAVAYLKKKGHCIVERNWSFSGYEIDIVSEHEEFIVFVEVKTRTSPEWGDPSDAVGEQRMRRMVRAASHYLKKNRIDKPARFDIVAVIWNDRQFELEHIEDAFLPFL